MFTICDYRKGLLSGLMALLCLIISVPTQAQTPDPIRADLDYTFALLNKSRVPTGYLWENGYAFVKPERFNGAIQDSNAVDMTAWRFAYGSVVSGHIYGTNSLPTLDAINTSIAPYEAASTDFIALPAFLLQCGAFDPNAYAQNRIGFSGEQVVDYGMNPAPYVTKRLFAVAPTRNSSRTGQASFVFKPGMFYSNAGLTVTTLQADFGDGQGYRTMSWETPVSISYNSAGTKKLKYRITMSNNAVYEAHSDFTVESAYVAARFEDTSVDDFAIGYIPENAAANRAAGMVSVVYSLQNKAAKRITRPLIVAEGYDVSKLIPAIGDYTIRDFINEIRFVTTNTGQTFSTLLDDVGSYDLIFINYSNGTDDIRRNARLLEEVVRRVNALKATAGSTEQNVVMGISMGGLVARYGLAEMVRNGENTQTRLLMTHDSPHRGANAPLTAQALNHMLMEMPLPLGLKLTKFFPQLQQGIDLMNAPASQQMLLYRATNPNGGIAFNAFLADGGEYRQMVDLPANMRPYQVVGTSQGAECGQPQYEAYKLIANCGMSTGIGVPLFFLPVAVVNVEWTFKMEARGLPNGSSQRVAYLYLQRKWKVLGVRVHSKVMYEKSFYSPANSLPWDNAPGGFYGVDLPAGTPTSAQINFTWSYLVYAFAKGGGGLYADKVGFVPTVSALDIQQINSTSIFASYNSGISPYNSRLDDFITQEPYTVNGQPRHNRAHVAFTSRNAGWLFNKMQGTTAVPNVNNCGVVCGMGGFFISGNDGVCGLNNTYTLNAPADAPITWSVSNGIAVQNILIGNSIIVRAVAGYTGQATITARIGDCPNNVFTKTVLVSGGTPSVGVVRVGLYNDDYYICPKSTVTFQANIPTGATISHWQVNGVNDFNAKSTQYTANTPTNPGESLQVKAFAYFGGNCGIGEGVIDLATSCFTDAGACPNCTPPQGCTTCNCPGYPACTPPCDYWVGPIYYPCEQEERAYQPVDNGDLEVDIANTSIAPKAGEHYDYLDVRLYTLQGVELYAGKVNALKFAVPTQQLAQGVYVLRIKKNEQVRTLRVMIRK